MTGPRWLNGRSALIGAPYLWLLCMLAVAPSVLFWDNSQVLGIFILLFGLSYTLLYGMIVRFKAPRWLVLRR